MQILPADANGLQVALGLLRKGGVVAHATETCYGLACDLSNPDAVKKLFAIKQRPETQPVSALFSSLEQAKQYVEWNDHAEELARQYLPGPLTLILPLTFKAPSRLLPIPNTNPSKTLSRVEGSPTIGLRLSPHPVASALAAGFGSPLSTTSANIHGQPNPYSVDDLRAQFGNASLTPDLVLDSGTLPPVPPSTVMNLTGGGEVRRQGSVQAGKWRG